MISLLALLGIIGGGAAVAAVAMSGGNKISDEDVERAFCDAVDEGVRSPAELQYLVARILVSDQQWPPPPGAPGDVRALWDKLGQVANRVGEGGLRCP